MAHLTASRLPALRKQHLLVEFAGLKQACPEGVFVSLTPDDPSMWSGVLFVRDGPYAPAVLRFQILFPLSYPRTPPLITFTTDMFHPLIAPLSTHMYSADFQENGTMSAADHERLPPGGFSLKQGFPDWFPRKSKSPKPRPDQAQTPPRPPPKDGQPTPRSVSTAFSNASDSAIPTGRSVSMYEVLRYMRTAFDDEAVLDAVQLPNSGNPGAWHAWRTHRVDSGHVYADEEAAGTAAGGEKDLSAAPPAATPSESAMRHGDWNWQGVWEERVKKGINASLTESALYGGTGAGDDVIRFLNMEENDVETAKENIRRTLGQTI
ncbi:ubiquitin-conjugating enzyme/RWD-like protein [Microdochium trichocladiopsis]|uniref:Ubiquitin-conjugating enzyme/RWD-like protein n=1 Tax=Microdochium trichocladiopsis TaxID=1682393 RepID=A0A9P8Y8F5_9PEZI|nr:ubiquitin-conjugating enzyme/RWD-like protein [Microdochium trichocladiopsis]KAH7030891.1 ubiquitin-conjugating enzyme/RWD-like protein [Microdochium trichocladiopsis]